MGETVPILHLDMKGEKTLKNLNSNNLKPNASKALLTQDYLSNVLIFKIYPTNALVLVIVFLELMLGKHCFEKYRSEHANESLKDFVICQKFFKKKEKLCAYRLLIRAVASLIIN
jgi:hypothetical protein